MKHETKTIILVEEGNENLGEENKYSKRDTMINIDDISAIIDISDIVDTGAKTNIIFLSGVELYTVTPYEELKILFDATSE